MAERTLRKGQRVSARGRPGGATRSPRRCSSATGSSRARRSRPRRSPAGSRQRDTIELDGAALPAATELGVGGLGYARFLIPDGPHDIRSQSVKFGIEVYGYDCRISYAYPGGLSLGEINQPPG